MQKELTSEEAYKVLERYDPQLYNHYLRNGWYFGWEAKRYAEYLLRQHGETIENVFSKEKTNE